MTDNDIIKALECCMNVSDSCFECPFYNKLTCTMRLKKSALDLINRMRAEIERLRDMVAQNEGVLPEYERLIKHEAFKDLAEKLKSRKRRMCGNENGGLYWDQAVLVEDIDRAVKEMTEENDA